MSRDDWYCNATWNAEIEADFAKRLRRARLKEEYLRIQASCLAKTHPTVALGLLEQYFALDPSLDLMHAQAFITKALAQIALSDFEGALASYEGALEVERHRPGFISQAYLDYPCFVIEARLEPKYAQALEVLDTHRDRPVFPVERFRSHGARALLLHHFGQQEDARTEAGLAMAAAQETQSGFRYHQNLGLVGNANDALAARVAALIA